MSFSALYAACSLFFLGGALRAWRRAAQQRGALALLLFLLGLILATVGADGALDLRSRLNALPPGPLPKALGVVYLATVGYLAFREWQEAGRIPRRPLRSLEELATEAEREAQLEASERQLP